MLDPCPATRRRTARSRWRTRHWRRLDVAAAVAHLSAAVRRLTEDRDCRAAAMACVRLGEVLINFMGNTTAGKTWFLRAQRLIEDEPPCLEQGYAAEEPFVAEVDSRRRGARRGQRGGGGPRRRHLPRLERRAGVDPTAGQHHGERLRLGELSTPVRRGPRDHRAVAALGRGVGRTVDLAPSDRDTVHAEEGDDQDMAVFARDIDTASARPDAGWPHSSTDGQLPEAQCQDAELVVSELVTNALRHGLGDGSWSAPPSPTATCSGCRSPTRAEPPALQPVTRPDRRRRPAHRRPPGVRVGRGTLPGRQDRVGGPRQRLGLTAPSGSTTPRAPRRGRAPRCHRGGGPGAVAASGHAAATASRAASHSASATTFPSKSLLK